MTSGGDGGSYDKEGAAVKPKWIIIAVTALAISSIFSACTRTDPKPAGPPEKVTIAYATLTEAALAQVAQTKGYYRDEGLDVTAHLHPYGKLALKEVLEGKADFATVAETPLMLAIMNGEKISVIASILRSQKNHAIVARKDMGIASPQELKGRKIGVTFGITSDFFLDGFLAAHGIPRDKSKVVNLKPDELQNALVNGDVEAVSTFYPFLSQTQNKLGDNGITFNDKEIYTETFNVVATQEFIRKNPDKVRKMLRALVRAEEFAGNNPAETQQIVAKFSGIEPGILSSIWADLNFDLTLNQSLILVLEDESRWAIKNGLTSARSIPNYLDFIYIDGLCSVKPGAVRILR